MFVKVVASFNKEEALLKGDEHQGKEHDDDDETTQKGIMIEVELDPLNMINSFPILAWNSLFGWLVR